MATGQREKKKDMCMFLMAMKRKKATVFLSLKENTSVHELKKMTAGITNVLPENQRLYRDEQ